MRPNEGHEEHHFAGGPCRTRAARASPGWPQTPAKRPKQSASRALIDTQAGRPRQASSPCPRPSPSAGAPACALTPRGTSRSLNAATTTWPPGQLRGRGTARPGGAGAVASGSRPTKCTARLSRGHRGNSRPRAGNGTCPPLPLQSERWATWGKPTLSAVVSTISAPLSIAETAAVGPSSVSTLRRASQPRPSSPAAAP